MVRSLRVPLVEGADRDTYFELKVRERFLSVPMGDFFFDPSEVLLLDRDAYRELKIGMLSDVQSDVVDQLDGESQRRLYEVLAAIPKGGVVPVFGAGMSVPSGYPGWSQFLLDLAHDIIDLDDVRSAIDAGDFELVASSLREALGPNSFEERMAVFGRAASPSEVLLLAVDLFSRGHFVTTNFDSLIEEVCRLLELELKTVEGCDKWSGWSGEIHDVSNRVLLKLHGHFRRPNGRVLLAEEYETAYSDNGPVRRDLKTLFESKSLVFMGASLRDDRTMRLAQELVSAKPPGASPRHHAFLPRTDRSTERESFLGERGIFAIWYPDELGDHAVLGDLLWWARESLREGSD